MGQLRRPVVMQISKTERIAALIFISALYLCFLYAIVYSIRQGVIVRINGAGTSREKNPLRFWFHISNTAIGTTLIFSLLLYCIFKENN